MTLITVMLAIVVTTMVVTMAAAVATFFTKATWPDRVITFCGHLFEGGIAGLAVSIGIYLIGQGGL